MSSCRCGEIHYFENCIVILDDAISRLNECSSQSLNIAKNLISLSTYSGQAYSSSQLDSISSALKGLNDDMIAATAKFQKKVMDKKTLFANRLSEARREDQEYHEEEKRKAEEELKRKAAETANRLDIERIEE